MSPPQELRLLKQRWTRSSKGCGLQLDSRTRGSPNKMSLHEEKWRPRASWNFPLFARPAVMRAILVGEIGEDALFYGFDLPLKSGFHLLHEGLFPKWATGIRAFPEVLNLLWTQFATCRSTRLGQQAVDSFRLSVNSIHSIPMSRILMLRLPAICRMERSGN